ncbi:XRE family transcriptional regulator [Bombilactobacillus bombi]|uniref:helix-turn-helix domain-containing protein n=1 Tax=Bombilactobacillus bombi TaxID=1303590 RepID=UPI000E5774CE|nr:helix-turn-helix transcriptional regulator [Bombilactobacillus bombi]AXX64499.1 XRE family transcriptional regulator [Bombilactobacillus bombi]
MNKTLIPELRRKKSWTQEYLADKCGLSVRTIQRLESGEDVSTETLRLVAEALAVKVGDLFESIQDRTKEDEVEQINKEQVLQLKQRNAKRRLIKTIAIWIFISGMIVIGYAISSFPNNNLLQIIAIPIWLIAWPVGFAILKALDTIWLTNKLDKKYPITRGLDGYHIRK